MLFTGLFCFWLPDMEVRWYNQNKWKSNGREGESEAWENIGNMQDSVRRVLSFCVQEDVLWEISTGIVKWKK